MSSLTTDANARKKKKDVVCRKRCDARLVPLPIPSTGHNILHRRMFPGPGFAAWTTAAGGWATAQRGHYGRTINSSRRDLADGEPAATTAMAGERAGVQLTDAGGWAKTGGRQKKKKKEKKGRKRQKNKT